MDSTNLLSSLAGAALLGLFFWSRRHRPVRPARPGTPAAGSGSGRVRVSITVGALPAAAGTRSPARVHGRARGALTSGEASARGGAA